jgi:hypothetical protein
MPLHEDDLMIWIIPAVTGPAVQFDGNPINTKLELEFHLKRLGEFSESFVNIPDFGTRSVGELPLLPATERDQVFVEFNSTKPVAPVRAFTNYLRSRSSGHPMRSPSNMKNNG